MPKLSKQRQNLPDSDQRLIVDALRAAADAWRDFASAAETHPESTAGLPASTLRQIARELGRRAERAEEVAAALELCEDVQLVSPLDGSPPRRASLPNTVPARPPAPATPDVRPRVGDVRPAGFVRVAEDDRAASSIG